MTASSFLSYGGVLKEVVRTAGDNLNNANAGVGVASTVLKIYNYDDYLNNHQSDATFTVLLRTQELGQILLGEAVRLINATNQIIGISTNNLFLAGARVGFAVTANIDGAIITGIGTTGGFTGF